MSRYAYLFHWIPPKAGPIGFPKLLIGDIDAFCQTLVKQTGILLLPGTVYDQSLNHFRVGFVRANFKFCLQKFDEFLQTLDT